MYFHELKIKLSIPVLNDPLQTRRSNPTRRLPIPLHTRNRRALLPASLELMHHLARLPVPKAHPPTTIAARHKTAIGANIHVDGISTRIMPDEPLLPILAEPVRAGVDVDLVVAGLQRDGLVRRVRDRAREGEHVRLGDELDGHGDVDLPRAEGLVV